MRHQVQTGGSCRRLHLCAGDSRSCGGLLITGTHPSQAGAACPLMTMYAAVAGFSCICGCCDLAHGDSGAARRRPDRFDEDQSGTTLAVAWVAASIARWCCFRMGSGGPQPIGVEVAAETIRTASPSQTADGPLPGLAAPVSEPTCFPRHHKVLFVNSTITVPGLPPDVVAVPGTLREVRKAVPPPASSCTDQRPALEPECGLTLNHIWPAGGCGGRMAKEKNTGREMEPGCSTPSFEMTRDDVKRGLREVAQVTNFDEHTRPAACIRADVQLAQKLA